MSFGKQEQKQQGTSKSPSSEITLDSLLNKAVTFFSSEKAIQPIPPSQENTQRFKSYGSTQNTHR